MFDKSINSHNISATYKIVFTIFKLCYVHVAGVDGIPYQTLFVPFAGTLDFAHLLINCNPRPGVFIGSFTLPPTDMR
jgi:hypothetical protein